MGYQYKAPMAELSSTTGGCRIGIQPEAAIAIIVIDTTINVVLTALFVWQLRPALKPTPHLTSWYPCSSRSEQLLIKEDRTVCGLKVGTSKLRRICARSNMRIMLVRNVVGSSLLLLITIANNALFLARPSTKTRNTCLLMCLSDGELELPLTKNVC